MSHPDTDKKQPRRLGTIAVSISSMLLAIYLIVNGIYLLLH